MSLSVFSNFSFSFSFFLTNSYTPLPMSRITAMASPATWDSLTLRELLKTAGSTDETVLEMTDSCPRISQFPLRLSFTNLTYSINIAPKISFFAASGENTKVLLNDISGEARDGELFAILGASGSGKSTLIDALADRMVKGSLKGTVKVNGEKLDSEIFKSITTYVMQDDVLFPMLTVKETLTYAARLRLPGTVSESSKRLRVEALIDQLGLRNAADTIIGDVGHRGVSGGERRRVSIGVDIIHDPIVLLLDEPTSGLDSTCAYMVVKVLKRVARSGSVVVMSIHQPSSRIVRLLDRILLLSCGRVAYYGSPVKLPLFFDGLGYPIPEKESPIEFALDLISELEGSPGGTNNLVTHTTDQSHNYPSKMVEEGLSFKDTMHSRGKSSSGVTTFPNPFWTEMGILMKRSTTNLLRMPALLGIRFAAVILTSIILGTMFWHLEKSPRGVHERVGFFSFGMSSMFYSCADVLPTLLYERFVFLRETAYNAYRRSSYVLSNTIMNVPPLVILAIPYSAITFYGVGLEGGLSGFCFYYLVVLSSLWSGNSFVTCLSGLVPDAMIAYTVGIAVTAYYLVMSGFFITRDRIPIAWLWFHYASIIKYPYEAALQNEFDDPSRCFVRGSQIFDSSPLSGAPAATVDKVLQCMGSTVGMNITRATCVATGAEIMENQAVTQLDKWQCLWITFTWGVFFRIVYYFALMLGSKNKRR